MLGRALRTVDVHTHVYLPRYVKYLQGRTQVPRIFKDLTGSQRLVILPGEDAHGASTGAGRPVGAEYYDPQVKLAFMSRHDIGASILSLANPWLDFVPKDTAIPLARDLNQDLHAWCEEYPSRFYAFGVLPTVSVDGSIAELTRLSKMSSMRGVIMGTYGLGKGLDDPDLEPVFAKIAELGLVVFMHPHYGIPTESFGERDNGHVLPLALGFPFETTLSITRLILTGIFDRIPSLKILLAHSGRTIPCLAGRLDSCVLHDNSSVASRLNKAPSEYLKNLYYDAVSYHPPALKCVSELVGIDRLLFGTDHPFFPPLSGDAINSKWESVESNKRAIHAAFGDKAGLVLGGNAKTIFGI